MKAVAEKANPFDFLRPPVFSSKQSTVHDILLKAIVRGELKPGRRLIIEDLASQFGVSAIPVREALQQLRSEGFVLMQPHMGATVMPIEQTLVQEIFEMLEALETISGRAACVHMTQDELAQCEQMVRKMDSQLSDLDQWSESNVQLHEFICDCAHMSLVKDTLTRMLYHWDRLRSVYLADVFAKRVGEAQKQHWQMYRAIKARDIEKLEQIVRDHNRLARDSYDRHLRQMLVAEQV
jgi:DNA-binding GntR family transcriptional regulator